MKHKTLVVYVPFPDGSCEDIGRIELDGHALVSDKRLRELEAAEKHAAELEERCAVLTDALRLAVRQNSHDMLMSAEELRSCEATLGETK